MPVKNLQRTSPKGGNCEDEFLQFELEHGKVIIKFTEQLLLFSLCFESHLGNLLKSNFSPSPTQKIVLQTQKAKSSNQEILKMHSIHSEINVWDLQKEKKKPAAN